VTANVEKAAGDGSGYDYKDDHLSVVDCWLLVAGCLLLVAKAEK
jgi:hypothetical protein